MKLAHELHGPPDAPVVVLSSSLGTTKELWAPQLPVLAERLRVLAYDHPGHGNSDLLPPPLTIERLAEELLLLLDALGIAKASICGLSLGGMVATALALEVPMRVERIVLACTSAFLGPPAPWLERAETVRRHGVEAIADAVLQRWFTSRFPLREPETVARLRSVLVATPREGYARLCEAIARWDARGRLGAISAPTLVIAGADDPATPPAHAELLASQIPGARLTVLEEAAHLANVEQHAAFTAAIMGHLTEDGR